MEPTRPRWLSWRVADMVGLPIIAMTAYLLWIWPRPAGTSLFAEFGPYLISLSTGLSFAFGLARGRTRLALILALFVVGFLVLWVYALTILCGIRDVCL